MGHFTVLKGAYPSLQEIERTSPLASGETGVVRGSLLYDDSGSWKLAGVTQQTATASFSGVLWVSLQPQDDLSALMAGDAGAPGAVSLANQQPSLSALQITMPMSIQTDQFDSGETYPVGSYVMVGADGKWTPHTNGKCALAVVLRGATPRHINDATAVTSFRTGVAQVNVIELGTVFSPNLTL